VHQVWKLIQSQDGTGLLKLRQRQMCEVRKLIQSQDGTGLLKLRQRQMCEVRKLLQSSHASGVLKLQLSPLWVAFRGHSRHREMPAKSMDIGVDYAHCYSDAV